MSKYNSRKLEFDGQKFDSKKELRRWQDLRRLEQAGRILDLKRQVSFELIPTQRGPDIIGPRGGVTPGKVIEYSTHYIADFVYQKDGVMIVEDVKGFRTDTYIIKRKLMLWVHGIRILET